jgi:hypothetical protein
LLHPCPARAGILTEASSDSLYSVSYTDRSLDAVLIDLAERMNISLVYNPELTRGIRITITLNNQTTGQILSAVIRQAGLRLQPMETGTFAISPQPQASPPPPPPPPVVITGVVSDSVTNTALEGVRVFSAGMAGAVYSDSTGYFRITGLKNGRHTVVADLKVTR